MTTLYKLAFILSLLGCVEPLSVPEPTGPFVTGVQDFEFLDSSYPSPLSEDDSGRRLMVRAYYPVCNRTDFVAENNTCGATNLGRRRLYFEEGEFATYFGDEYSPLANLTSSLLTFSHLNAPMEVDLGPRPILIYAHGAGSYVSDNTALFEECASQGYAVFSLGLPGFASGVVYPNGDTASLSDAFIQALNNSFGLLPLSLDIGTRYDDMKKILEAENGAPVTMLPRYRDDMLAMAEYLQDPSNDSTFLKELAGDIESQGMIYLGYSFGGAAATSAAHIDTRANGAVNMDGLHQSSDLLGKSIRVPFLTFASQDSVFSSVYVNEFFWEELESMGTDPDVTRVLMPENTTHGDFSDFRFLPPSIREVLLPEGFGTLPVVDGENLHAIMVDFILGFADTHTGQRSDWTPEDSFSKFDDVESIDVSYVADWAQNVTSSAPAVEIPWYAAYAVAISFVVMTL